jgi:DNA-binding GntR family transcriptional regulator
VHTVPKLTQNVTSPTPNEGDGRASVADVLREMILAGVVDDPIREEQLAADLGVSRTPVREAMGILIGEGLLLKEQSRSARVFRPSLTDLRHIYEIRTPLEGLAARGAAVSGGAPLASELSDLLEQLANAEPGLAYSAQHEAFHMHLVEAHENNRLTTMIRTLRAQSEPYVRIALQTAPDFIASARRQHLQIVAAVRAQDGERVEQLIKEHLQQSITQIPAILGLPVEASTSLSHSSGLSEIRQRA